MRALLGLLALLTLAGCASTKELPQPTAATKQIAVETFLYAQMAANAYNPNDSFQLPPTVEAVHYPNDPFGFAYSVFRVKASPAPYLVLAFRGTENGFEDFISDWVIGNFLAWQNDRGLEVYEKLRKDNPGARIVLVGHSLGGGIAQHVGLRVPQARVIVFNTSTRFTRGPDPQSNQIDRVAEFGEVNRFLDWVTISPRSTLTIVQCVYGNPLHNHSQRSLAACLTKFAAHEKDDVATWSVSNNPDLATVAPSRGVSLTLGSP